MALGAHGSEGPQTHRILKLAVGSFGLDYVRLTEASVMDPRYEIWEKLC